MQAFRAGWAPVEHSCEIVGQDPAGEDFEWQGKTLVLHPV